MTYSQNNIDQLFQLIGRFPNQHYGQSACFDFIKTTDCIWPNQLINFRATVNEVDAVLNQIEIDSENGEIPSLLMLNPIINGNSIINQIKKRDYKLSQWMAMTHDLKTIEKPSVISDFEIKLVERKSDLGEWLKIVESELMANHSLNTDVFNQLLENNNCFFYLGFNRKQPVATSFLYVNDQEAGVYLVSTKKSHRKKGIGKEMTRECLLKSKELKCNRVDLQATEFGRGVYQSLGFENQGIIDVFRVLKKT